MDLLCDPIFLALAVSVVAIVTGGVVAVVKILIRHQERMGMIQQGLNPDSLKDPCDDDD
ncbi:MAG: hypothetical protein ACYTG7_11490 [Planctomycetota bacterium]|jgi:hypothetical protein